MYKPCMKHQKFRRVQTNPHMAFWNLLSLNGKATDPLVVGFYFEVTW